VLWAPQSLKVPRFQKKVIFAGITHQSLLSRFPLFASQPIQAIPLGLSQESLAQATGKAMQKESFLPEHFLHRVLASDP
jgi:hypothetical protein